MIAQIKNHFFSKKILEDTRNNKCERELLNLKDAKTIGLVYDGTDFNALTAVRDFEVRLKQEGKSVSKFVYLNNSEEKFEPFIITNKNLNWFGYPNKPQLFEFCKQEFDILFGFFYEQTSPLNVIFANSKSKLRVSGNLDQDEFLYDFLLQTNTTKNNKQIIQKLTDFLSKVKTK